MAIDSLAKLREVYRPPAPRAGLKVLDHLDVHCRKFIALSPFYVISSARADGRSDASPRGDPPGSLAYVLDDTTLLLPDRPGNRQVDTLMNVVERPYVGLVFFVPGLTETLRVNGGAEISTDPEHLKPLAINGKPPISVLKVTVEEAFLHCAKALIRARLWEADAQVERSRYPTYGQVLADQIAGLTLPRSTRGRRTAPGRSCIDRFARTVAPRVHRGMPLSRHPHNLRWIQSLAALVVLTLDISVCIFNLHTGRVSLSLP